MSEHPPPRVRITSAAQRTTPHQGVEAAREIDAQTPVGEVYMRSLMRSQLRLAAVVIAVLVATLGMIPLTMAVWPSLRSAELSGVPLYWLALGVGVYPLLLGLGWFYVRQAERNEQDFTELVTRRGRPHEDADRS